MTTGPTIAAKGYTLVEMLIAVAILAIISGIAIPIYRSYTQTAYNTEGMNNLQTLRVAQEEHFLENGSYFECTTTADCESESDGLWTRAETAARANFEYAVDVDGNTYTATATGNENNASGSVSSSVVLTVTKN